MEVACLRTDLQVSPEISKLADHIWRLGETHTCCVVSVVSCLLLFVHSWILLNSYLSIPYKCLTTPPPFLI